MDDTKLLEQLKSMYDGNDEDSVLQAYLSNALGKVRNRLYPYGDGTETVPERFSGNVVEIAIYLLNKRGAEGQTSHKEGDISRDYESGSVPESMLSDITPFVGVI